MTKKPHRSIIRTIYLYLFSIVGLVLIIVASVDFIDMALKAFIFTEAEKAEFRWEKQPPMAPRTLGEIKDETTAEDLSKVELTEAQKNQVESWLNDYRSWQENQKEYDPVKSGRQQDAARNIAMLLVGIPIYAYHWSIIKKETKS